MYNWGEKHVFLPFFFSTLRHSPCDGIVDTSATKFSVSGWGFSLSESYVFGVCSCLVPLVSIVSDIFVHCGSIGPCGVISCTSASLSVWLFSLSMGSSTSTSSSSSWSGGGNFQPLGCSLVFFFLQMSLLSLGHVFCGCSVCQHILHLNAIFS